MVSGGGRWCLGQHQQQVLSGVAGLTVVPAGSGLMLKGLARVSCKHRPQGLHPPPTSSRHPSPATPNHTRADLTLCYTTPSTTTHHTKATTEAIVQVSLVFLETQVITGDGGATVLLRMMAVKYQARWVMGPPHRQLTTSLHAR